jgi:hypothetical protein
VAGGAPRVPERMRTCVHGTKWFYPVLTLLTAAAIVGILVQMFVRESTRSQILLSLLAWALALAAYFVRRKAIGEAHLTQEGVAAERRADQWMHEHAAAAEVEVDAAVGEGRLAATGNSTTSPVPLDTRAVGMTSRECWKLHCRNCADRQFATVTPGSTGAAG